MDLTVKFCFGCSDLLTDASDDPKTAQFEAVCETAMFQNTVTGKHCPQYTFTQNTNIKVIFFLKSFTLLKSLITMISSVSNIMKQFQFSIHGLAFLTPQSTCLSLTAGMHQCQLQLPSVTTEFRNFAILPHFPWLLDLPLSPTCHVTFSDDLRLHRSSWLCDTLKC